MMFLSDHWWELFSICKLVISEIVIIQLDLNVYLGKVKIYFWNPLLSKTLEFYNMM